MPKGVYVRTEEMKRNIGLAQLGKRYPEGRVAWNKGVSEGEGNRWKGESVGYSGLHMWVRKHLGKPLECDVCNRKENAEWANKSHEYKRDLEDWIPLCRSCHRKYDDNAGSRVRDHMGRFI